MHATPGFYGKMLGHGDFVARGLPRAFVEDWDRWLAAGMQASREALGAQWLEAYLASPVWRFALADGTCGASSWAGVLMPSVDRVGRHFPLTIAVDIGSLVSPAAWIDASAAWYGALEAHVRLALDERCDANALALALSRLDPPHERVGEDLAAHPVPCRSAPLASMAAAGDAACRIACGIAAMDLRTCSFWWTAGGEDFPPSMMGCRGLPEPTRYAMLLDAGNG